MGEKGAAITRAAYPIYRTPDKQGPQNGDCLRVVLIGDRSVGKTCLLRHYLDGVDAVTSPGVKPTAGIDEFDRLVGLPEEQLMHA